MIHEATAKRVMISDAASNDYEIYQRLYKAYAPMVYGIIVKAIHDERAASDMLRDVFVDLCSQGVAEADRRANPAMVIRLTNNILHARS